MRVWVDLRSDSASARYHGVLALFPLYGDFRQEGAFNHLSVHQGSYGIRVVPERVAEADPEEVKVFTYLYRRESVESSPAWILWISKSRIE